MKPRHRLVAVAALVALLAVAAAGAARAVVSLLGPHEVRVPRVVGMAAAAARERLGDAGLEMDVSAQVSSLSVSTGRVLSQTPAAGAAEQGSRVRVVLSAGPPVATVPDVTGLALDAAAVRVRAAGMTVGRVTRTYSAASRGTVVGQEPASGRARWGSEVALVVSRGPEQTTVPAVTGSAARAKRALLEAGLMPRIVLHSESAPRGRVLSTSPRAGAVVSKGATVEVTVSRGPTRRTVVVPDVRTGDVRSAAARLERLGLRVRVARSCRGGTTVVETDPVAGASIRQSEVVTLFVC
jgi:serine/threonine-protein kinase